MGFKAIRKNKHTNDNALIKDDIVRSSEKDFKKIMAHLPGGLVIMDVGENLILTPRYISDGFCEMLDITQAEAHALYGKNMMAGVHPDDLDRVVNDTALNCTIGNTTNEGFYRIGNGRGKYIWVKTSFSLVRENSKPVMYAVYTDATHEMALQQEIEQTSRTMQAIVDNIPGGVVKIVLQDDKIIPVYVSDSWCAMMGDTKENIMRLYAENAMAGVHPDDYDRVAEVFTTAMKTGQPINAIYRVCNSRNEYRWINNKSSLVSDENGIVNYYAVYTDITEEIKVKQKIAETNRDIEFVYNVIPGAVFKCRFDADWTVIFANDGLFRFLGYTREEFKMLFDNKMSGVIYPEDGFIMVDKITKQLLYGTTVKNENRLICKDGSIKWISIHAELMTDENEEQYFYCVFVDITEQKKAEVELASAQQKLAVAIDHAGLDYWEYDIAEGKAYFNSVSSTEYKVEKIFENYPQSVYDTGTIHADSIYDYQKLIDAVKNGEKFAVADIKTIAENGEIVWKRVRFTTLFDDHNMPFWAVATAESIDEYKELEQQFALAASQTGTEAWVYDVANKTITRTATTGADFGVGIVIENIPEKLIEIGAVHPDDIASVREMYAQIRAGKPKVSSEIRMYRQDIKGYTYHKIDYTVLFDRSGKPERAIGTGVDISEQILLKKRYQEAVALHHKTASERALLTGYCNITNNKMIEIFAVDGKDYIAILGDNRDEFFTKFSRFVAEKAKQREFLDKFLSEPVKAAYASGITKHTMQCRINLPGSSAKYVKFTVEVLKQPDTNELTGFFMMKDITSKVIFDKAIVSVVEKYCDWIVDVDVNRDTYNMLIMKDDLDNIPPKCGKFSHINEEYARVFADAQSTSDCIEKLSYQYMLQCLEDKGSYWFYYRILEHGEVRTKKIQVFYIDKDLGHIGFIRIDVTETLQEEQKKNEALAHALTSSERANKAKTDFLSRMSHDIRTPMNAIIGMTALTKQEIEDKDKLRKDIDIIDNSAKLLLRIINDVLDMAKIESGNMTLVQEKFDYCAMYENIIEMSQVMFDSKHQNFVAENDFSHQYFVGDVIRLQRVILNLLSNASKFTPPGGQIKLTAKEEKTASSQIANLVFAISDSGEGIPKDKIDIIFQPFEQLANDGKNQGTGLGLPIVKSIVETKGGTISVDSEVGQGSVFTVKLPMRIAEESMVNDIDSSQDAGLINTDFTQLHILLVEDHPVNTLVAKRLLENQGATVDTAENGSIAYNKFMQSEIGKYNIIFMDIQMPVMNGYEAVKAIRTSTHPQAKEIPIIAMTANAFAEDIQKSLDSGMNAHIAKPINIDMIAKAVHVVNTVKG